VIDPTRSRETSLKATRVDAEDSTGRKQCLRNTTEVHNGMHKDLLRSQRLDGHHRSMQLGPRICSHQNLGHE
jgi:hypothetical protein